MALVLGIVKTNHEYWYWVLLRTHQKLVLVLGIVKASLEILGIGIGVKKVVLLMSDFQIWVLFHCPLIRMDFVTKSSKLIMNCY